MAFAADHVALGQNRTGISARRAGGLDSWRRICDK